MDVQYLKNEYVLWNGDVLISWGISVVASGLINTVTLFLVDRMLPRQDERLRWSCLCLHYCPLSSIVLCVLCGNNLLYCLQVSLIFDACSSWSGRLSSGGICVNSEGSVPSLLFLLCSTSILSTLLLKDLVNRVDSCSKNLKCLPFLRHTDGGVKEFHTWKFLFESCVLETSCLSCVCNMEPIIGIVTRKSHWVRYYPSLIEWGLQRSWSMKQKKDCKLPRV